jgi:sugar phosphate isomerase/epimerase
MFKNLSVEALGISGTQSEVIELALSYGFKGLDLDIVDFASQVKAGGMAKARRLYDSARLKFASFRLPVEWHEDPDRLKNDLAALPQYLEIAKELGCTRAITSIEPAGDMRPFHENFEFHRRKFGELAAAVQPYGIRLGIEFLAPATYRQGRAFQFIQTVDQVLLLFKSTSAPNLGLVIDTWNWHLGGGTIEQIRFLSGDRIVAVYLSDCDPDVTAANATEQSRRLPGETGVIDASGLLTLLGELRYDGPITPNPFKGNLAGQSRDKIVKAASASVDQAWKAAGLNPQGKLMAAAK